jgi:hypothetical protein
MEETFQVSDVKGMVKKICLTIYSGETNIIRFSRGLFATILILTLLSSLIINVFLGPIQETGLTPTKDLHSLKPPLFLKGDTMSWNVVLVRITLFKCPSDIFEGDVD